MPAARQTSRSPCIALAVIATIGNVVASSVWRTVRTSPRPPQPSQLFVPEPLVAPLPPHDSQASRQLNSISRVAPRMESPNSTVKS